MSVAEKLKQGVQSMPVKELPMPPVKVQRPDSSGGIVTSSCKERKAAPVPHLANVKLNFAN